MKKSLTEALKNRFYLDGAMGTTLVKMGLNTAHPEIFNVEKPDVIKAVHESYFSAGSNAVCTNTFGCNRKKADLSKYSLEQFITSAYEIAREAAKKYDGYVLYDCGPIGELLYPYGRMTFDEAYEIFAEQAKIVATLDFDGVLIETVSDLQEMRAAFLAFSENTPFSVLTSMTFEKNGRTFAGTTAESFAMTASALGAVALGLNCGTGAKEAAKTVGVLQKYSSVPVFVKPNAGMPKYENGVTFYDMSADEFAAEMEKIAENGVGILGGCCGTDETYIAKTIALTKDIPVGETERKAVDGVCSYAKVARFDEGKTLIIGERVNPTGKPLLKQAIRDDNYDYILSMCVSQAEYGADMLDINLGMAGIDEEGKLVNTVSYIQGVADLPLVIDTAKKNALERAVRITNGICVINSVSGEKEVMERVFPVAKKYGSYIVALCLDEDGIPDSVEKRIAIAKKILQGANAYGIEKDRLLFDPLTMAVSVCDQNGVIVLETLRRLRDELCVKTTLGLSNISFGLPNRDKINGTFLKMIQDEGFASAIINPSLKAEIDGAAKELLLGNDRNCAAYIAANAVAEKKEDEKPARDIKYCILHGLCEEALAAVKGKASEENYNAVIDEDIIGGLNELGVRYEKGEAFLPQLIAGSEAAKVALDYIKGTFIGDKEDAGRATVVLATVKGDVHDIGKNIVKAVTGNYGYKIIDLGKDVCMEEILRAIETYQPDAIGLSALMTTTIDNMTDTVRAVKAKYPSMPVIVGGAVVTAGYAESVGAIYSKDARQNVKILEKLFPNR